MECDLYGKILLVGIGENGSRIARQASSAIGWDYLNLGSKSADSDAHHICIPSGGVLNPSMRLLRANATGAIKEAVARAHSYDSVLVLAALGEKDGAALAPMMLEACAMMRRASFVTMPFAYEKERIFESGVALKRVMESSGFTSVVDNEAMLKSNPDLSVEQCSKIASDAAVYVLGTLAKCSMPGKTSIISSARPGQSVETSLRDSLKALYGSTAPDSAGHCILHISGKNVPVGMLDSASKLLQDTCKSSSVIANIDGGQTKLVMASAVAGAMHFDSYDPLSTISKVIDWDELECGLGVELELRQIE